MLFDPFQICEMNNFLSDSTICNTLRKEIKNLIFLDKNNDLYKFKQVSRYLILFNIFLLYYS